MLRVTMILVVALALLSTGCDFVAQKAVEQATGAQIDKKGESVTIKGKEGEQIVISGQIPDELKSFPVPQGFKSEGGGSFAAGGDKLASATWKGKGTSDAVLAFYTKEMATQGWKEELSIDIGKGAQRHYSKGPQSAIVAVDQDGDQVNLTVILGRTTQTPQPAAKPTAPSGTTSGQPTTPPSKPQAAPTPAGPPMADASALPPELKDIPAPSGFGVVKGKVARLATGGKFNSATAAWLGKTAPDKVAEFYKQTLPSKGWKEEIFMTTGEGAMGNYVNANDPTLVLNVVIQETAEGTEVLVTVVKQ